MMKNIWIFILGVVFFVACSKDDDSPIIDSAVNCETVLGWDEIVKFIDCTRKDNEEKARSIVLGEWKLKAWDCGFCDPTQVDTPSVEIVLLENGEGTSVYTGLSSEEVEFTWSVETSRANTLYINTEPKVWHIQGSSICEAYLGHSNSALDGPTYVYSKCK